MLHTPLLLGLLFWPAEIDLIHPKLDPQGNWLTNVAPIQGHVKSPDAAGGLWRVIASGLRCRQQPQVQAPIVQIFARGNLLQADIGRGGADEVVLNPRDARGGTWMRVRDRGGNALNCYVRAQQSLIRPVLAAPK